MEPTAVPVGGRAPDYEDSYHKEVHGRLLESPLYYDLRARQSHEDLFGGVSDQEFTVFEFGIGLGKNVVRLEHREGLDVSAFARSFCSSKGIRVFDDLGDVPKEAYDRVLISHVLEHLEQPAEVLREVRTLLREGGELLIVLPVERNRSAAVEPDVHQHLYSWTFQTLSNLLARTGYEVIENRYRYGTMHYRLRYLGRLHYPSYDRLVRSLGRLLNRREMVTRAGLASPGFATG